MKRWKKWHVNKVIKWQDEKVKRLSMQIHHLQRDHRGGCRGKGSVRVPSAFRHSWGLNGLFHLSPCQFWKDHLVWEDNKYIPGALLFHWLGLLEDGTTKPLRTSDFSAIVLPSGRQVLIRRMSSEYMISQPGFWESLTTRPRTVQHQEPKPGAVQR